MKVLFYFFKNVHIPLFDPIIQVLSTRGVELYFAAPDYNPQIREGLSPEEKQKVKEGTWLSHSNEIVADVALMADCVAERLQQHRCIVNIGHGLISKGQYYSASPLIGRENLADILCVPGPWHKETLEKFIHIPVVATGMSKLDSLFTPFSKNDFCRQRGIDPFKKIILWAPTFNMELSSIPVLWTQIRKLCPLGQVLIKLHGTTDSFFKNALERLAQQTPDLFYITEADTTPYMKASDLMITDVSSVMFEYTVLDKPIVLVDNPHQEEYVNYNPQDVEYTWRDIGPRISSASELYKVVEEQLLQPELYATQRRRCAEAMFVAQDGKNSERIADVICNASSILPVEERYQVFLDSSISVEQFQYCVGQLQPSILWLHEAHSSMTINASFPIKYYSSLQKVHDQNIAKETIVVFQRPSQLVGKWKKSFFGNTNYFKNEIIGTLSTSAKCENAKVISHLKIDRYAVPEPVTPENLSEYVRLTNTGEKVKVTLDSPILVVTPIAMESFLQTSSPKGYLLKDVLAIEPN